MGSDTSPSEPRPARGRVGWVLAVGLFLVLAAALAWFRRAAPAPGSGPEPADARTADARAAEGEPGANVATARSTRPPGADFVSEAACAACHAAEAAAWRGTDHDLAMQEATPATVLGDFADANYRDPSTETRFTRDEQGFALETEGPDGKRARFDVPYVFGVDPLQQVLVQLPRGRLQALSVAWDPARARWFSLYPGERIDSRDALHWTRPPQNWNFSCAECHATDLRRNYDAATDSYATTWSRMDVGCQACHGPAGRHIDWALGDDAETGIEGHGFDRRLGGSEPGVAGSAAPSGSVVEIETCARCHARRAPLGDGFDHRNRLLDDYLPALLTEDLYHADGQILDEVYEYGSFLQSKMYLHGLRCSDCHDPHSQRLKMPGNTLCASCHSPTPTARAHVDLSTLVKKSYDSPEHHHHAPGGPGSKCVDCHMPTRTYMAIDERRDHGFRVPRPDLAAEMGAPDACGACHADEGPTWAASRIDEWSGPKQRPAPFGLALQAGRRGRPGAAEALLALVRSKEAPIVRATALTELARYPSAQALAAFVAGATDPDGLVRLAALGGLELFPPEESLAAVGPLLSDPLRGVRAEAARMLARFGPTELGPFAEPARAAVAEFEAIQHALLERPEAHLNLAQLELARGRTAEAEAELRAGLRLDPLFVPCYVNLADLARTTRGEPEAEGILRDGLALVPDAPALHHALGLALVRQQHPKDGLAALARAAELAPRAPRYGFVHAVALHDLGEPEAARAALERVLAENPEDRDARFALANYRGEAGDQEGAERCLRELAAINPHDPGLAGFLAPSTPGR